MKQNPGPQYQLEAGWRTLVLRPLPGEGALSVCGIGKSIQGGEILCAIARDGFRRLLVPAGAETSVRVDSEGVGIRIRARELIDQKGTKWYAEIICRKPHLNGLFTDLCSVIVDETVANPGDAGNIAFSVLERWRDLLAEGTDQALSEKRIVGLYAELWYLREMCKVSKRALDCWTGPDAARHDFAAGAVSIEVKATRILEGRRFRINGIWQLEPPLNGKLYLGTLKVEQVPQGGESLVEAVRSIASLGVIARQLWDKLSAAGYRPEHEDIYASRRFKVLEQFVYPVDAFFPSITRDKFINGQVPPGISRVEYEIDLVGETPKPLTVAEASQLLGSFAR